MIHEYIGTILRLEYLDFESSGYFSSVLDDLPCNRPFLRHRDFTCGYTALHWACKHGNLDMVKLLAGTYQVRMSCEFHSILYKYIAGKHQCANAWRIHTSTHRRPAQPSGGFWPTGWCLQGWRQCEGLCWQETKAVYDGAGITTC